MIHSHHLLFFATAWCQLVASSSATTTNDTSVSGCENKDFGPPFNSTGTVSFVTQSFTHNHGKPWYLSVGLKDRRDGSAAYPGTQTITGYVSVPDDFIHGAAKNTAKLCVYHLGQRNGTVSQDGSCHGVLDDACTKYIQSFQEGSAHQEGECPVLAADAACGSTIFQLAAPVTLQSSNCSASAHDALTGVPEAYSSQPIFDVTWPYGDGKVDSFAAFDAHVQQPNPVLLGFGARQDREKGEVVMWDSKLLCVAPVNGTAGSRDARAVAGGVRVSMGTVIVMVAAALSAISLL